MNPAPPPPLTSPADTAAAQRALERAALEAFDGLGELVDEDAFRRWCAVVRERYGAYHADDRALLGFRDLAAVGSQVYEDKPALARVRYIWRRMEEAWSDYCLRTYGYRPGEREEQCVSASSTMAAAGVNAILTAATFVAP